MSKLSVVIVSYNVKYYLDQCLYSLHKALRGMNAEIIVFDNHSRDGSVEYLSNLYPKVTFVSSSHNLGFAKGNNSAIRQSTGDYILLLNPDTIVGEKVLSKSVAFMDSHPDAGAVGVRMERSDGGDANESRRGVPTPMTAFYKMTGLCGKFPKNRHFGHYYMGWLPWDKPSEIEIVSGAFCMVRRKALQEIGLLDEGFFMYGEDIDLSYRLLKGGWHNWYLPLRILHYKGESTEKSSFRYVHVFYEAMLIFFRKHYGHLGKIISIPIQFAIYFRASLSLLGMITKRIRRMLGFVASSGNADPLYVFYLSPENMAEGQMFARHKGLWAEFHDANKNKAETPSSMVVKRTTYVVYDVSVYSFDEILQRFSIVGGKNLLLGTYYPHKQMLITGADVIM